MFEGDLALSETQSRVLKMLRVWSLFRVQSDVLVRNTGSYEEHRSHVGQVAVLINQYSVKFPMHKSQT